MTGDHLPPELRGDYQYARSQTGWGDRESGRWCKRCGEHFRKDPSDPMRCRNCFAPKHESVLITADAIDEYAGSAVRLLGEFAESGTFDRQYRLNPEEGRPQKVRDNTIQARKRRELHQRLRERGR